MKKPSPSHSDANSMSALPTIKFPISSLITRADFRTKTTARTNSRISFRAISLTLSAVIVFSTLSAHAQSLWKADTSAAITADRRARAVGDIITILVQENNTASKDNTTSSSKSSSIDASIAKFLYSPAASGLLSKGGTLPAMNLSSKQAFDGGGKISNSEKITARIAVRVQDVLPNGNFVIEGRRTTTFSGETQEAVLRGVIRAADITPANTIYSYNIADATIKYVSTGTITDNQRKGWFTRTWEKINPF
jgi:flagellar L-ring protein precursor FlgH